LINWQEKLCVAYTRIPLSKFPDFSIILPRHMD